MDFANECCIRDHCVTARRSRGWLTMCVTAAVLAFSTGSSQLLLAGQRNEDSDAEHFVVVKAGRVITVSGEEFAPGMVVMADGKISLVGSDLDYPPSADVIEAPNETVMPGFVLPRTRFALRGYQRSGVHGDQNVSSEVYLAQMDFSDFVEAGYTTVCYVPAGKGIPGMACAYRTGGPEDERKLGDSAYLDVVTYFDSTNKGKDVLRKALKKAEKEIEKVEKAKKEWEEKQAEKKKKEEAEDNGENEGDEPSPDDNGDDDKNAPRRARLGDEPEEDNDNDNDKDSENDKADGDKKAEDDEFKPPKIAPKHQPLVDLIQEKEGASMMVRLGRASDLHHLDAVLKEFEQISYSLWLDIRQWRRQTDFHRVAEKLGERSAQVLVYPEIYRLPHTTVRYNLLSVLAAGGCEVSILPGGDSRDRYLGIRGKLADAVRAGLTREAALKSLTLHPANLIGHGERIGSIEKGKDADLVFLDGDPLDPHSKVRRLMIRGEIVWDAQKDEN